MPAFVVVRPDWITAKHIQTESNAEVRRVMLERYGTARYLRDIGAKRVQADDYGELYEATFADGLNFKMVKVINGTPEPDGSYKEYMLGVPVNVTSAPEAVAKTYGRDAKTYHPVLRT